MKPNSHAASLEISSLDEYYKEYKSVYEQFKLNQEANYSNQIKSINKLHFKQHNKLHHHRIEQLQDRKNRPILYLYIEQHAILNEEDYGFLTFLIKNGADKSLLDPYKNKLIYFACKINDMYLLKWLIEECHYLVEKEDDQLLHPLEHTLLHNDHRTRDYLIPKFPECSKDKQTALIIATIYNRLKLVNYLIDQNYDTNAVDSEGKSAIFYAITLSQVERIKANMLLIFNKLISKPINFDCEYSLIHFAYDLPDSTMLEQLLLHPSFKEQELDINTLPGHKSGFTLLHHAIHDNNTDKRDTLLKFADPNILDPLGRNLAIYACVENNTPFASFFMERHKLDINAITFKGMNALHHCIKENAVVGAQWLIYNQSFDMEARTFDGDTALLWAARCNAKALLNHLLFNLKQNKTVDVTAINHEGKGLGHYLVEHNQHLILKRLLDEKRLNIAQRDTHGLTILDLALTKGTLHQEIILTCIRYLQAHQGASLIQLHEIQQFHQLLIFFCSNRETEHLYIENKQPALHLACLYLDEEKITDLINTFHLDVNQCNGDGEKILSFLLRHEQHQRAEWFRQTFNPSLTDLNKNKASLLHIASQQQDETLVRTCIEKHKLCILSQQKDKFNSLEIVLSKQNKELSTYLWNKLTPTEQRKQIKQLYAKKLLSALDFLEELNFYKKPAYVTPPQKPESEALVPAPQSNEQPDYVFDHENLIAAIQQRNIPYIKAFKHRDDLPDLKPGIIIRDVLHRKNYGTFYHVLRIKQIKAHLDQEPYALLLYAVQHSSTSLIKRLLKFSVIKSTAHLEDNEPLFIACQKGYSHTVELLLNQPTVRQSIINHPKRILLFAAASCHSTILSSLLSIARVREQVNSNSNEALCHAVMAGNINNVLILLTIEDVRMSLHENNFNSFCLAIQGEHDDIAYLLLQYSSVRDFAHSQGFRNESYGYTSDFIQPTYYLSPMYFNENPDFFQAYMPDYQYLPDYQLHLLYDLLYSGQLSPSHIDTYFQQAPLISSFCMELYDFLIAVIECRAILVLNQLLTYPIIQLHANAFNCEPCLLAIEFGDLDSLKSLLVVELIFNHIASKHNKILRHAIRHEKLDIITHLLTIPQVHSNITALNNLPLRMAAQQGNISIVNLLLSIPDVYCLSDIFENAAFQKAAYNQHTLVAHRLLVIPHVFNQVSQCTIKFKSIVETFIEQQMKQDCHYGQQNDHWEKKNISEESFRLYFSMLNYCIKKNNPAWHPHIIHLLQNDIIKARAHLSFMQEIPENELLLAAQRHNNGVAAQHLLTIKHVYDLAVSHDFYSENHGLKLKTYLKTDSSGSIFNQGLTLFSAPPGETENVTSSEILHCVQDDVACLR